MRKRFITFLLILSLTLTGCQLAKPEAEAQASQDMMVGVFVTTEYLDLLDLETYFAENPLQLISGNGNFRDDFSNKNRYWATKTGTGENVSYQFENLEGMLYAMFYIETELSQFNRMNADPGICDGHREVRVTDEGMVYDLSGTIYFTQDASDAIFYMNPVYQTEEGEVYLVPGDGIHFSGDLAGSMTQRITNTSTRTENGETTIHSTSVEITVQGIIPAESLTILCMDESSNIIQRLFYALEEIPTELDIPKNTAYVLVEEPINEEIRRSLYQPEDTYLEYYRPLENGICEKATIALIWAE